LWANFKYCMLGTAEENRETIGMVGFTADMRTRHGQQNNTGRNKER